jgi:hypothetical protein
MGTDQPLREPDPADLLASCLVDGEEAGVAAAQIDPPVDPADLPDRVAALSAVVEQLAQPVTLPPEAVIDAQIARAIELRDIELRPAAPSPAPASAADVTPIGRHRDHRAGSGRTWLAVAAAVAVLSLGAGIAVSLSSPSSTPSDVAASSASDKSSAAMSPAERGADPGSGTADAFRATGSGEASALADLGDLPTEAALTLAVESSAAAVDSAATSTSSLTPQAALGEKAPSSTSTTPSPGPSATPSSVVSTTSPTAPVFQTRAVVSPPPCDAAVREALGESQMLVFAATAHFRGVAVQIFVFDQSVGASPAYRLVVADAADCRILLDQAI